MVVLIFVILLFMCQAAYWRAIYIGFKRADFRWGEVPAATDLPPLSVIVAARDEAETLPHLLEALERQTHPDFEVIIVDDASTDETATLVREWMKTHPRVRLVQMEDPVQPRKKHALMKGIAAAEHDHLAFTDADCKPHPEWLASLASFHAATDGETIVTGYSPYHRNGRLLGTLAGYETFVTGVLTAAAAGLGRPYMAVGRSISYSRTLFHRGEGYRMELLSGDDDLFIQTAAKLPDIAVVNPTATETFVYTDPPASWRAWLRQKCRHTSAGHFYNREAKLHLGLFHGTDILLWTAPLWAGLVGLLLLGSKLAIQSTILYRAAGILREPVHLITLPGLEFFYAAYNLVIAPLGLMKAPKEW